VRRATLATVLAYAAANALGTRASAQQRGRAVIPFLPLAFATMHLAYGAGSILGALGVWRPGPPPEDS